MQEKVVFDCPNCKKTIDVPKRTKQYICSKYIDAAWDFYLEHSRITNNGGVYVNFGITTKDNLNTRIWSRANGYSRPWEIPDMELQNKRLREYQQNESSEHYTKMQRLALRKLAQRHWLLRIAFKICKIDLNYERKNTPVGGQA